MHIYWLYQYLDEIIEYSKDNGDNIICITMQYHYMGHSLTQECCVQTKDPLIPPQGTKQRKADFNTEVEYNQLRVGQKWRWHIKQRK